MGVMKLNGERVDGMMSFHDDNTRLAKIQFVQVEDKKERVLGELVVDYEQMYRLFMFSLRNFNVYYGDRLPWAKKSPSKN